MMASIALVRHHLKTVVFVLWYVLKICDIGSFAGEIRGGYSTYYYGMAGGLPLILVNYLLPMIIFYLPLPLFTKWGNNYFVAISYRMNVWYSICFNGDWYGLKFV